VKRSDEGENGRGGEKTRVGNLTRRGGGGKNACLGGIVTQMGTWVARKEIRSRMKGWA